MAICVGAHHTTCLDAEGSLWVFGRNDSGQLGLEDNEMRLKPERISLLPQIRSVSCGFFFTVCSDYQGNVWSFGKNDQYQLGTGDNINYNSPQQVQNLNDIISVHCGWGHVLCLTYENTIYGFGRNEEGQLGLENNLVQRTPQLLPVDCVDIVSCGGTYSILKLLDESFLAAGGNSFGQLGINDPRRSVNKFSKVVFPNLPDDDEKFTTVSCGNSHTLYLTNKNNVYGVGANNFGQLKQIRNYPVKSITHIKEFSNIELISCGRCHSFLIDKEGKLFSFGDNENNKLGTYGVSNVPLPCPAIAVSQGLSNHTILKDEEGEIWVYGKNDFAQLGIGFACCNPIEFPRKWDDSMGYIVNEYHTTKQNPFSRTKSARK